MAKVEKAEVEMAEVEKADDKDDTGIVVDRIGCAATSATRSQLRWGTRRGGDGGVGGCGGGESRGDDKCAAMTAARWMCSDDGDEKPASLGDSARRRQRSWRVWWW
ncbi:hypothetical protein LWI29_011238 [Acer saccharum]|uniref:Uncharacterized protein n=1 Tax=Acer saccharum TaxID=4024 RepID=A0AA39RGL9_ACESA|nr:hypothetical protein LWI29_011238 [Acer saccharum]